MSHVARNVPVWKPSYALIWTNAAAAQLVRTIAPFLLVKTRQAETLITFDERIRAGRRSRDRLGRLLPLRPGELRARQALYQRLKELNRRGIRGHRSSFRELRPIGRSSLSPKYVAGFIDAEGSLMITKTKLVSPGMYGYRPRISVANTKRDVLVAIQHGYGGILVNQPARNPAWSQSCQLIWTDRTVDRLLSSVKNYLVVRASQARVMSQFIRLPRPKTRTRKGRALLPSSARGVELRESLRKEIKDLNRKGLQPELRFVDSRGALFGSRTTPA
jgi:hypothetical protein